MYNYVVMQHYHIYIHIFLLDKFITLLIKHIAFS